jgi:glycosyltransferase involved in cell wall biosynthesis
VWHPVGAARVMYLSAAGRRLGDLARVLATADYDLLYLNSLFSPQFTLKPLLLRAMGRLPDRPIVLAPRGELAPGCLAIKPARKQAWLALSKPAGLYRDLTWHASGADEAAMIRQRFGPASIIEAADLPSPLPPLAPREPKRPGALTVGYVSRITANKNFAFAIEAVRGLTGTVTLNAYGPVEDHGYWQQCLERAATLPSNVRMVAHGAVPHHRVGEVMARQDVLLLPSHAESFGHVIAEALGAGCPVLISDRTPWRDVERDGCGWDLPLERPEAFIARLAALQAMDEPAHAALRRNARATAEALARSALAPNRDLFATTLARAGRSAVPRAAAAE